MFTPNCPVCQKKMLVTKLHCKSCNVEVKGTFDSHRFSGFSSEQLNFMEAFIIAGGNLKELQQNLALSYPTVRTKLDTLVLQMKELHDKDTRLTQETLTHEIEEVKHAELISKLSKKH